MIFEEELQSPDYGFDQNYDLVGLNYLINYFYFVYYYSFSKLFSKVFIALN